MDLKTVALFVALALPAMTSDLHAEPLDVGATAPAVTAIDQDKHVVDFASLYQRGYVLVYFYPKADTSGCTAQACSLRDAYAALTEHGVIVVGVSTDNITDQKAFHEKYNLPFTLIPDPEHNIVNAFGVPLRNETRATRQAYLIKNGTVVWRDLTASTTEQAADVLAALTELEKPSA